MASMDDKEPTVPPSAVLAGEMPQIRKRQGLTAEVLAKRVRDLGGQLDRAAVSKIENGLRDVSLDEAILLAAALNVSPLHLFLPRSDIAAVSVTPEWTVPAPMARQWVRGTTPLKGQDDRVYKTEVPESEWTRRSVRVAEAEQAVEKAHRRYRVACEKLDLLTLKRGQLDDMLTRTLERQRGANLDAEELRLDARIDVALDQVAEATVTWNDARQHLERVKAEEAVD